MRKPIAWLHTELPNFWEQAEPGDYLYCGRLGWRRLRQLRQVSRTVVVDGIGGIPYDRP